MNSPQKKVPSPGSYREILSIAYPLILSTASMTIMHFVDRMFLSWYSHKALAAATPAGITSFTIVCFFMGVPHVVSPHGRAFFSVSLPTPSSSCLFLWDL